MEIIQIDWLVVFIAAAINMVIGFFWYSKWLFGDAYQRLQKNVPKKMGVSSVIYGFLVSLLIAFFLSFFQAFLGVTSVTDGIFIGFCFWLGFVATTQISAVIWSNQPIRLFFLHTGYRLVSYLVMSGILGA
jgi:hypothetical protein